MFKTLYNFLSNIFLLLQFSINFLFFASTNEFSYRMVWYKIIFNLIYKKILFIKRLGELFNLKKESFKSNYTPNKARFFVKISLKFYNEFIPLWISFVILLSSLPKDFIFFLPKKTLLSSHLWIIIFFKSNLFSTF